MPRGKEICVPIYQFLKKSIFSEITKSKIEISRSIQERNVIKVHCKLQLKQFLWFL